MNIWRCFSDNDEYNEDENDIIEQIQQLQQQYDQSKNEFEHQRHAYSSSNEQLTTSFRQLIDIFVSFFEERKKNIEIFNRQMQCKNKQQQKIFYVLDNK